MVRLRSSLLKLRKKSSDNYPAILTTKNIKGLEEVQVRNSGVMD
jgi:hypothetical protein